MTNVIPNVNSKTTNVNKMSNELEQTWRDELNSVLWKNIDMKGSSPVPMNGKLQPGLEHFIKSLLSKQREELVENCCKTCREMVELENGKKESSRS